jgi:hypothetical protein
MLARIFVPLWTVASSMYRFWNSSPQTMIHLSLLWHMVSKFHSFWHCAYESQFGHPSTGRTYINEDYMQHIRAVGMANRYAVSASRRSLTVAERITLGRSLELFLKGTI